MPQTRWYDKDNQIKLLIEALEKIDDESQLSVALDVIQMVIFDRGNNTDDFIKKMNSLYIPARNRWYDKEENIHSAVEMLKFVEEPERSELLREILYSIMYFNDLNKAAEEEI